MVARRVESVEWRVGVRRGGLSGERAQKKARCEGVLVVEEVVC